MSAFGELSKVAKPLRSTLDEALEALTRSRGTGPEFLKELEKTKGVKPTEIKERGLDKALATIPKVSKEEIKKVVQSKANPKIEQKMLGADTHLELNDKEKKYLRELEKDYQADDLHPSMYNDYLDLKNRAENSSEFDLHKQSEKLFEQFNNARENGQTRLANELSRQMDTLYDRQQRIGKVLQNPTKYEEYTLPNGQNYREILLKLPQKEGEQFTQGHFDEPNLLAHMRVSDRAGPNGEKVLHLEELQSDWHQKGRDKGYRELKEPVYAQAYDAYIKDLMNRYHERLRSTYGNDYNISINAERDPTKVAESMGELDTLQDNFARMYQERNQQNVGVPDAPFKKNWHEVALKKLINYATENGYDKIAITPGAEQAIRYSLAKHINELHLSGTNLVAYDHYGNEVIKRTGVLPEDLPELIGKEATEKLLAQEPQGTLRSLTGQNLEVGGEGMKGFYDKILPDYLNKLGKPHGAKVQLHSMPIETGSEMSRGASGNDMVPTYTPTYTNLHTFDLTPSLKNEVTQKGLPLYQQIAVPLGGAEAVRESQPEPEPKMRRGGKVKITDNPDAMHMAVMYKGIGGAVKAVEPYVAEGLSAMAKLRNEFKARAEMNKAYEEATKNMYTKDMPSFEEWQKTYKPVSSTEPITK
jgi:hypothetical protein